MYLEWNSTFPKSYNHNALWFWDVILMISLQGAGTFDGGGGGNHYTLPI